MHIAVKAERLTTLLESWIQTINYDEPYFVVNSLEEARSTLELLIQLGFEKSELSTAVCGTISGNFMNWITQTFGEVESRSRRFSRGDPNVRVAEMAIFFKTNGRIGEVNRNVHRALVVAWAATPSMPAFLPTWCSMHS